MKLLHFYEWRNDNFAYNLKTDLGEKINIAKIKSKQTDKMYDQMMDCRSRTQVFHQHFCQDFTVRL